jgi:hypothetical protein
MTNFMQKSFSVFNNYAYVPKCEQCGDNGVVFFISTEGKVCAKCHAINKSKRLLKKLEEHSAKS